MRDFIVTYEDGTQEVLSHFGIQGMKWGVRRYQNPDGSYTTAGKKRYSGRGMFNNYTRSKGETREINDTERLRVQAQSKINKVNKKIDKYTEKQSKVDKSSSKYKKYSEELNTLKKEKSQYAKDISNTTRNVESLVKKSLKEGYSVTEKGVHRANNRGRAVVGALTAAGVLAGSIAIAGSAGSAAPLVVGLLAGPLAGVSISGGRSESKKYKVKTEDRTNRKSSTYVSTL